MSANKLTLLGTVLRQEGLWSVLNRLAFRFFHIHAFPVFRLRLTGNLPEGQIPLDIDVHEATKEELDRLRQKRRDLPEYFYRDQTDPSAARCWVAVHEGELGFIVWFACGERSSGLLVIGKEDAELGYIYCMRELRGRHLSTNAILVACRTLRDEGIRNVFVITHARNPASIKSFQRCGFVQVGTIRRYFGLLTRPRPAVDYSRVP